MPLASAQRGRLLEYHNIARHCRARDMINGVPRENAFRLRPGEEFLSTNWLEYFHESDRQAQIVGVHQALSDKGFRVGRNAAFAILNVGVTIAACKRSLNLDIQVIALGEAGDPSHTGIYGYSTEDTDVAALLAASVDPNEVHPAVS